MADLIFREYAPSSPARFYCCKRCAAHLAAEKSSILLKCNNINQPLAWAFLHVVNVELHDNDLFCALCHYTIGTKADYFFLNVENVMCSYIKKSSLLLHEFYMCKKCSTHIATDAHRMDNAIDELLKEAKFGQIVNFKVHDPAQAGVPLVIQCGKCDVVLGDGVDGVFLLKRVRLLKKTGDDIVYVDTLKTVPGYKLRNN